jgi:hypothetical protein
VDFFELKNISEQTMRLVNPSSARKLLRAGRLAGMEPGSRVIDFGSGFAEPLALWASELGDERRGHRHPPARLRASAAAAGGAGRGRPGGDRLRERGELRFRAGEL